MAQPQPPFTAALLAGALAGTTVDLTLYPLDTLKTRLQSRQGLLRSGGLSGIYRGLSSVLVGSAPGASLFFITYETTKSVLGARDGMDGGARGAAVHMLAGSLGEVAACAVRVPTEVVKQRAQAGQHATSAAALRAILGSRGDVGLRGVWAQLYRGWGITVVREVPFTIIQFPLWEFMKAQARKRRDSHPPGLDGGKENGGRGNGKEKDIGALESGFYGSIAGAIAAGLTTPLDVLKTRVMLAQGARPSVRRVLAGIVRDEGPRVLFSGVGPRVAWISVGGAIFLGSYQWGVNTLMAAGL